MVDLSKLGITTSKIHANLSSDALTNLALETDKSSVLSDTGALIVYSGEKTGRSPKDKRIVFEESTKNNINWGEVNQPIESASFEQAKANAIDFFNTCDELYVVDGYAVWDKENTIKVRIICTKAYHALFMHNMLIRPSQQELANFGTPDYILYNAGPIDKRHHFSNIYPIIIRKKRDVDFWNRICGRDEEGCFYIT